MVMPHQHAGAPCLTVHHCLRISCIPAAAVPTCYPLQPCAPVADHLTISPNGDAFVKPSLATGVLPEILQELLAARKRCAQRCRHKARASVECSGWSGRHAFRASVAPSQLVQSATHLPPAHTSPTPPTFWSQGQEGHGRGDRPLPQGRVQRAPAGAQGVGQLGVRCAAWAGAGQCDMRWTCCGQLRHAAATARNAR